MGRGLGLWEEFTINNPESRNASVSLCAEIDPSEIRINLGEPRKCLLSLRELIGVAESFTCVCSVLVGYLFFLVMLKVCETLYNIWALVVFRRLLVERRRTVAEIEWSSASRLLTSSYNIHRAHVLRI